ncbi:MAG: PEP-CTERM sorting domain-containing protein [Pirellula sp.]
MQFNATAVPEPTSLMLLGSVALGSLAYRRVRKRS